MIADFLSVTGTIAVVIWLVVGVGEYVHDGRPFKHLRDPWYFYALWPFVLAWGALNLNLETLPVDPDSV